MGLDSGQSCVKQRKKGRRGRSIEGDGVLSKDQESDRIEKVGVISPHAARTSVAMTRELTKPTKACDPRANKTSDEQFILLGLETESQKGRW